MLKLPSGPSEGGRGFINLGLTLSQPTVVEIQTQILKARSGGTMLNMLDIS